MNEPSESTKQRALTVCLDWKQGFCSVPLESIILAALMAEGAEVSDEHLATLEHAAKLWAEEAESRNLEISGLDDQVFSLREQREEAIQEMTKAFHERDRLRAALEKYGDHKWNCATRCIGECNCGFSEALNQKGGQPCAQINATVTSDQQKTVPSTDTEVSASKATPDVRPLGNVAISDKDLYRFYKNTTDSSVGFEEFKRNYFATKAECMAAGSNPKSEEPKSGETDTPETDAEVASDLYGKTRTPPYVKADFARKIERERDYAERQRMVNFESTHKALAKCATLESENDSLRTQIKTLEADKERLECELALADKTIESLSS